MPVYQQPLDTTLDRNLRLYRQIRRIRRAEETIAHIYPSDKIKSPVHLSIGQESAAVALCDPLQPQDVVAATYRSHAAYIAKGGSLSALFAELYGRDAGCARGRGGSMHVVDVAHGVLGTSAVVGTTIPVAVGWALAFARSGTGRVVVAFFGDGATEEGVFYESLNFAALHRLPVLFACENNGFAIHTPIEKRWATRQLCDRVATYGIPAQQIKDIDVVELHARAASALARIRAGGGPEFIECMTYRWMEHVGPNQDFEAGYRSECEWQQWRQQDPMEALGRTLPPAARLALDTAIETEIEQAVQFAEASPFPDEQELMNLVYA